MARDNSPKARQRQQLERKLGQRAKCDRILIVCEGSKTEPLYFEEIRIDMRLPTANIAVSPSDMGTEPIQVVQYACQLFEKGDRHKGIEPRAFEQVYAVFDRDDHRTYFDALKLSESLNGKLRNDSKQAVKFLSIVSVPSFELWLLLHFEDIRAPLHRDEVMRKLKQHIPGYEKGKRQIFAITRELLDIAKQRAMRLTTEFSPYDEPEPYTAIVELVQLLTGLRT